MSERSFEQRSGTFSVQNLQRQATITPPQYIFGALAQAPPITPDQTNQTSSLKSERALLSVWMLVFPSKVSCVVKTFRPQQMRTSSKNFITFASLQKIQLLKKSESIYLLSPCSFLLFRVYSSHRPVRRTSWKK